jgi:hypothetical protein
LETTKLALEQLKGSTETTIAQLRAELGEKSSELAASNQEGMVSMSELTLMEKEDEMKVLRGNVVNLTEKVESLKHGSAAMVGTIKYTVQDLKASKEVLQRDTRSIISGAVRLWEQLQPAVVRLIAIVNNVEIDKRELVRKYQSEVGWKHSALEMIGLSPPFKCQSLTYAWTVRLGCRTEITIQQDSRAQRQHSVLLSCPIRRSCGGGSQLHLGYRDSHSDRERWPHKVL